MRKAINWIISLLALLIAGLLVWETKGNSRQLWIGAAVIFALLHMGMALCNGNRKKEKGYREPEKRILPDTALTEIVLLGEEDNPLASWNIYGKNGLVIGRDAGENNVSINLDGSTYASMVDVEHAVLNYSGDCWYIEDISEKNGVSIQKQDGRKYRLTYGKPCKLERGDIICIALTRLQIL